MTRDTPKSNVQSGVPLPPSADPDPHLVARGGRPDMVRYERDADQLARVRHTRAPDHALPPDIPSSRADEAERFTSPKVADLSHTPYSPSVWEALPADRSAPEAEPDRTAADSPADRNRKEEGA
jgi:hypothetical protein